MDAFGGTKISNKKASIVPVCAWTTLYVSEASKEALHAYSTGISNEFIDDIDAPVSLKVSWTVVAYAPLIVLQAGDGNAFGGYKFDLDSIERPLVDSQGIDRKSLHELFLVPGSGMRMLLHGGPERWRQGVEFVESSSVVAYDGKTQVKESHWYYSVDRWWRETILDFMPFFGELCRFYSTTHIVFHIYFSSFV